jgi:Tfp pilus assembly protein PilF
MIAEGAALSSASILTVVTLLIAVCGLTVTAASLKRKTDDTYTDRLEKRVSALEAENAEQAKELVECADARDRLTRSNFRLYERLERLEGRANE